MKVNESVNYYLILLLITALVTSAYAGRAYADEGTEKCIEIMLEVNRVSAANLVTSLYLSPSQALELRKLAREAQDEKRAFEKKVSTLYPEMVKNLRAVRKDLVSMGKTGTRSSGRLSKVEAFIGEIFLPHEKKMKALALKAQEVLTENQLILVSEFKPCLRLPREMSHPGRIGQVDDSPLFEKMLKRVRGLPKELYSQKESAYIGNVIRLKNRLHLEYGGAGQEQQRTREVFREARALSDSDFELHKKKLGEKLANMGKNPVMSEEQALRRIEEYLLEPSLIPLYEKYAQEGLR